MSRPLFRTLRPFICDRCRVRIAFSPVHSKRFESTPAKPPSNKGPGQKSVATKVGGYRSEAEAAEARVSFHGGEDALQKLFPRWPPQTDTFSVAEFANKFKNSQGQNVKEDITLYGRLFGCHVLGSQLLFLKLATCEDTTNIRVTTQVSVGYNQLLDKDKHDPKALKGFHKKIWRGDWIAVTGRLATDNDGNPRLDATHFPIIIAPSLQSIPQELTDAEIRVRNRHTEHIVNPSSRDILYLRAKIINGLRSYLEKKNFVEVNTPLLVAGAGGATARPFQTVSSEFLNTKLNLRVAPELFLKRMILGGMPKVFEIGPAFRNEGVDPTHNPEFTICEYYSVMTTLEDLIDMTQQIFRHLIQHTQDLRTTLSSKPIIDVDFGPNFKRLEFIPTLKLVIQEHVDREWEFPDLSNPENAITDLLSLFRKANIKPPMPLTLPRLLDVLASHFIEPLCIEPTFITHHPECMSPLAKSFLREPLHPHGTIRHRVSARAELFIKGREYVNCYEEENSPIDQRRKFEEQLALRAAGDEEAHGVVDESYVRALTWGMPPTGGWGCGVDRIVMLFGGKSRIADVLPFGNLRHVVGLGRMAALKQAENQAQSRQQTQHRANLSTIEDNPSTSSLAPALSVSTTPPKQSRDNAMLRHNTKHHSSTKPKGSVRHWPFSISEVNTDHINESNMINASTNLPPYSASDPIITTSEPVEADSTQDERRDTPVVEQEEPSLAPAPAPVPVMPKLMSFKDLLDRPDTK